MAKWRQAKKGECYICKKPISTRAKFCTRCRKNTSSSISKTLARQSRRRKARSGGGDIFKIRF